jgi:NAD(P)H-flavin reductase
MAPSKSLFTLKTKTALTHNVFELVFECEHDQEVLPGQFVMFFLASGLRRSYSIAYKTGTYYTFIIKQLEGGAGSTEICTLPLESTIT